MTKAKILTEFLFRTWVYDRGSQSGYIQSHLVEKLGVPFLPHRDSVIHLFGNALEDFLDARIKIMKDRSAGPNDII